MWSVFGPCARNHGLTSPPSLDGCGIYTPSLVGEKICGGCGCPINFHIRQTIKYNNESDSRGDEGRIIKIPAIACLLNSKDYVIHEDVDDSKQISGNVVMSQDQGGTVISDNSEQEVVGLIGEPSGIPGSFRLDVQDSLVTTSIDNGSPNTAVVDVEADQLPVKNEKCQILESSVTEDTSPEGKHELQDRVLIKDLKKERMETSNLLQISASALVSRRTCQKGDVTPPQKCDGGRRLELVMGADATPEPQSRDEIFPAQPISDRRIDTSHKLSTTASGDAKNSRKRAKLNGREATSICTACQKRVPSTKDECRHPLLKVLICNGCLARYHTTFSSEAQEAASELGINVDDQDASGDHCRWCSKAGNLLCCSQQGCSHVYCRKCVRSNLGQKSLSRILEDDDWMCFTCDPSPVKPLKVE